MAISIALGMRYRGELLADSLLRREPAALVIARAVDRSVDWKERGEKGKENEVAIERSWSVQAVVPWWREELSPSWVLSTGRIHLSGHPQSFASLLKNIHPQVLFSSCIF
jgi:hypothetical protein